MTHLASPIFRNHTTPNPPQVGTVYEYGCARAASATTSSSAVCSITCRLGGQLQIAILTSLHVLYLMVRNAFSIIILDLSNTFMFQHAESTRRHSNKNTQPQSHSISGCAMKLTRLTLEHVQKNKGPVSPELTWTFEI